MNASDLTPLALTLPVQGGDNGVWGTEVNSCLSALQTLLNQVITVVQANDTRLAACETDIAGLSGGVNLNFLTSDLLGVPNGIATLDSSGYVDTSQVVFR